MTTKSMVRKPLAWIACALGLLSACGGSTEAPAPSVAPPPTSVAPTPPVPAGFSGVREDFPAGWTALAGETPSATAAQEASDLAHVTVTGYAYPDFTTSPGDPMGEFAVPVWRVGSAADASTLADALVARARAGFPSTGSAYLVLPSAVVMAPTRVEADLTAHLATRGSSVARSIWPFVAPAPGTFPSTWQPTTGDDDLDADHHDVNEASERYGVTLLGISHRYFTTDPSNPEGEFMVAYYRCASLDDATSVGTAMRAGMDEQANAVRVGPDAAILTYAPRVADLEAIYRAHGLELQIPPMPTTE